MLKKIIALSLIAAMLTASLAGCADNTDTGDKETNEGATTAAETLPENEDPYAYTLPEKNYDGAEYKVMVVDVRAANYRLDLTSDEAVETVDSAAYKRNSLIEETYQVDIKTVPGQTNKDYEILLPYIQSSDYFTDIIIPNGNGYGKQGDAIVQNMLRPWNDLVYVDFDRPWWKGELIEDTKLGDKIYAAYGDITITRNFVQGLVFNKKLLEDVGGELPYDSINDGTWTIDKMMQYSKLVTVDVDGNGEWDENSRYCLLANETFLGNYQLYNGASNVVKVDDDGTLSVEVDVDKLQTIADKIFGIIDSGSAYYFEGSENEMPLNMFKNGLGLYYMFDLGSNYTSLRDIDGFDYGIAPMPKLDENQEDYICGVESSIFVYALLEDPERTGIITEALAAESRRQVYAPFVETMLQGKIARDERDFKSFDIMYENLTMEPIRLFCTDQSLLTALKTCIQNGSNTVSSYIESNLKKTQSTLDKLNENLADKIAE